MKKHPKISIFIQRHESLDTQPILHIKFSYFTRYIQHQFLQLSYLTGILENKGVINDEPSNRNHEKMRYLTQLDPLSNSVVVVVVMSGLETLPIAHALPTTTTMPYSAIQTNTPSPYQLMSYEETSYFSIVLTFFVIILHRQPFVTSRPRAP